MAVGSQGNAVYYLAGGNFSMWTYSGNSAGTGSGTDISLVPGAPGQGAGAIGIYNASTNGTTGTFYIQENYINSSPPYNFGESFVYVAYDAQGKIVGISAALDPTWGHHGPNSIVPTHYREIGKPGTPAYQRKPMIYQDMLDGMIFSEAMKDASRRLAFLKGELTPERGEVEITIDYKDTDMHTHPHPFGSDAIAQVVLMHPDSPCNNGLVDMLKAGHASEIVKMIEDGDLIPDTGLIAHPHSPIPTVKFKVR